MARLLIIIFIVLFCCSLVYAQGRQTRQAVPDYSLPSRSGQVYEETTTNLEIETEQQAQMSGEEIQGQSQDEETPFEEVTVDFEKIKGDYTPTEHHDTEGQDNASWNIDKTAEE